MARVELLQTELEEAQCSLSSYSRFILLVFFSLYFPTYLFSPGHTQSDEYRYLSSLLANTQRSNEELKQQPKEQFRLSLEDSDKIREMTRKVNQLETSTQKLKAQNYTLKININELKCKKGQQKLQKKEPVRIYEKLVFDKKTEAPPTDNSDADRFILKESISNIKAPTKTKSPEY